MKRREQLLLVGLIDQLVQELDKKYEYEIQEYEYPYFRRSGNDKQILDVAGRIAELVKPVPAKTLTGQQRAISGVAG